MEKKDFITDLSDKLNQLTKEDLINIILAFCAVYINAVNMNKHISSLHKAVTNFNTKLESDIDKQKMNIKIIRK